MSFGVWQVRPKAPNNCSTHTPFTVGPETSFALHVILSAGLALWNHIGQHSDSSLTGGWAYQTEV